MLPDDPPAWQVINTRTAYQNAWVTLELDDVLLPNGDSYEYTRLSVAGDRVGVGVVGFDATRSNVLMVREYRHGVGKVLWQFPAGLAEPDEDLASTALRELREETGYAPSATDLKESMRYLGKSLDTPPLGPLCSHIYAAWDLEAVAEPQRDTAEFLTIHWQPVEWLKEAVRTGEIEDRFVICAVGFLLLNKLI